MTVRLLLFHGGERQIRWSQNEWLNLKDRNSVKTNQFFAAASLLFLLTAPTCFAEPASLSSSAQMEETLLSQGFTHWQWQKSGCASCEIALIGTSEELQSNDVQKFMLTLSERKAEILKLYADKIPTTSDEYNLLAQMAVGILGRESKFFTSARYRFKEEFPWAVHVLKLAEVYVDGGHRGPSPNSRGPTQIKTVPSKIAVKYGVTSENLFIAENAALATIGFLIESLDELKKRVVVDHLYEVQPSTYVDYLPYIYFGSTKSLVQHATDPAHNPYIINMKKYMSWVDLLERPSRVQISQGL
jgi:hypothetical protein